MSANVAEGSDQIVDGGFVPFRPIGKQLASASRLLLDGALLQRRDPRRCVAEIACKGLPIVVIATPVEHRFHLATLRSANVPQTRLARDWFQFTTAAAVVPITSSTVAVAVKL